jgi:hypothetical protein
MVTGLKPGFMKTTRLPRKLLISRRKLLSCRGRVQGQKTGFVALWAHCRGHISSVFTNERNTKMTKNTIVALVTAAALAGVAAPAFAASSLGSNVGQSYDFDQALSQLQGRGVNAVSVELWGDDVVRAFIANADGSESMAFFTRDTLSPIAR